jgi:hypothetical protein
MKTGTASVKREIRNNGKTVFSVDVGRLPLTEVKKVIDEAARQHRKR